ncbi:MAG: nuclear transport factor 2 family protein [Ignavibacteriales bacterium]|nr:nuclear transport factor 2 family protein [Ignavibacteriales bacterium]
MTVQEIANRLVELCRVGDYETCYKELYSQDCVSIEGEGAPVREVRGMEAIYQKGKEWSEMIQEFHSSSVGDPIIGGTHFALTMSMDCTLKDGTRMNEVEVCVYQVKDGKIVLEQFFF